MTAYALVTGDFVRTGGMDVANLALARHLAARGEEVHLVAHRADAALLEMPGVVMHRVPKPLGSYLLGAPLLARAGQRWGRVITARGGRQVVNGGNCISTDTNWVHYVHAAHAPASAEGGSRRVVRTWAHRRFVQDERVALRAARLVIVNSERTRADVVQRVGVPDSRVRTVYYGTDPAVHRPPTAAERREARAQLGWRDDTPAVAFVGALGDRRKGFDLVFEAWRLAARERTWHARLVVMGAGQELPEWQARARREGLADVIRFIGFTQDVRGHLWACDAVVAPSRYEAYGLAVHEAVCCGLPAITSAEAGVSERLRGLEGLQVNDLRDPGGVHAAMAVWYADREAWRRKAEECSAALRAWTWDDMSAAIVRAMQEVA
ncbi:MAG TPA: glycosyltransferase family 4 protein [Gemmatimonadaceae bacterium]|jgi:glycosyltransferase involved in cell wall biosynthesis|nr:glycosyltransferase family 4 protein [Gemmatimonadaceae bacterium]